MKRSATGGTQTLDMNKTDFERAAGGRKAKFTFNVTLHKGRIQNATSPPPPVVKELATILQEDQMTRVLVRQYDYDFSMNAAFQLTIKNVAPDIIEPVAETSGNGDSETTP